MYISKERDTQTYHPIALRIPTNDDHYPLSEYHVIVRCEHADKFVVDLEILHRPAIKDYPEYRQVQHLKYAWP